MPVALLLLVLSYCMLPMQAQAEAPAYRVAIDGAGGLTSFLNDNLDISRRQSSTELSEDEVQRLVGIAPQQIRSLLATEGYFSSTVKHELDRESSPWVARFTVVLGPRTLVESVTITFKGDILAAHPQRVERLKQRWLLQAGGIFQQKAWDDAKSDLLKALLIRDYPTAAITQSSARIEPDTATAVLTVEVDSGPGFTFGELQIEGLQRYQRSMIDELNPIKPGEPYSQEKLNELQARVQNTGYFKSVFATVEMDASKPVAVPIRLDLTENERKRLSLGVGFSTDSGARGQIKWLDRNFLDRNWRLESNLRIDRDTRVIGSDVYLQPISNGWRPSVGAHYEYTNSAGEINNKLLSSARLTSPDTNDEKVWALSFYADRQRIGEDFSNNREALIGSFIYTRRRVNNLILPSRGYVASIELGAGPAGVINKKSLARVVGRATYLSPYYDKRWQAVLRGQVGQVFGADRTTVPGDLLFRTGGDQTVRGYSYNTLGVAQNGAIVGGTVTAVVSAELVYRITPEWGAALFTDAGNAADSWSDFKLKQGSGVGARWRSPIGQVNLDLAYGHETKEPRLHFSIGYGF
ncbi:MAG: autotransporter assembly complex family protein [Herminiimonas sp.]|nr:autotransporter assembly complex family protein [Herminiimonas sp.]